MTNKELLSKELPGFVQQWEEMTKEQLIEAACGEVLDGLRMQERVQVFMEECTINMSKTTYSPETLMTFIKEKQEADIDDFCFLACEEAEDGEILDEIKARAKQSAFFTEDRRPLFKEWPTSSNVTSTDYDAESNSLTVVFKNGGVYRYAEVPADVYKQLITSTSVGSFIAKNIKGKYKSEKL